MIELAMQLPDGGFPLPEWLAYRNLGERWHLSPPEVMRQPSYWVRRELAFMAAEAFVDAERRRKQAASG